MPSSLLDSLYYRDLYGTEEMRNVFSDETRFQAWLETEIALAKAQEQLGIIPDGISDKILRDAPLSALNISDMKADYERIGFPILPFVKQLQKLCDKETAKWIHYGATTQDILDTGTTLQIKQGIDIIERESGSIIQALKKLILDHEDTVMAGRTFQQLAAPITFGFKSAVWLDEILRHRDRFDELKKRILIGQCSGAVGTFATLGDKGLAVQKIMMKELGLKSPDITWHTARDGWTELIHCIAMLGATFAKIANEVSILMRSEVGELSEPFETGRGASSTMPQKRNPISCEPILAIAPKLRELSSSQLTAMIQEHERGVWHMPLEWLVIPEAFVLISGSLKHTRFILENLWVGKDKMLENLNMNGGQLMAEAVMMGLASKIGKGEAHRLVAGIANQVYEQRKSLKEGLLADETINKLLTEKEIDELLDPLNYIGSAKEMIQLVLNKI